MASLEEQPPAERRLGARMSDFEDRYVSVGGVRTRYWQAGSEGSPVILLHGIGCSVLEWQANMMALAVQHRVYAVDLLGCGLTEKPSEETYTVPRLAQSVLDFLSANAIQRAHFAGFSLGGRIALECALVAPERVSSMVLVAPAGMARDGTLIHFRLASVPLLGEMLIRPTPPNTKTLWRLAFWDPSFVTAEFVAAKLNLARLPGAKAAFLKTLRSGLTWRGLKVSHVNALRAALPTVGAPTLVIWGKQDKFLSVAHAEVLRRSLPNVQIQIFDHCGHLPQIEYASRFNQATLDFWGDLADASGETFAYAAQV
jgi:pimeloyl-ACP methyl ester carboxylesterase